MSKQKILVIGDWQNAYVTAACLASLGHDVTHVGDDRLQPPPPLDVEEPGLDALYGRVSTVRQDEYMLAWIAPDVPVQDDGCVDVTPVWSAARVAWGHAPVLIVSSQVPVGTCRRIERELHTPVVYVPENMRLGNGVETFLHPKRIVIGVSDVMTIAIRPLLGIFEGIDSACTRIVTTLETAEMIKHATNAWLAMNISFANEIALLGSRFNIDMKDVTKALRADERIGPRAPLVAGDGFGKTLLRDVANLACMPGATLNRAVLDVNRAQYARSRDLAAWKGERDTCSVVSASSRVCERGTRSCIVRHC